MRKIQTREEIEKKKKRKRIIVGSVLIFLMVFSSLGYAFLSDRGDEEWKSSYNDYVFIKTNRLWGLEKDGGVFYFQYLPQEIENVSVTGFYSIEDYFDKPLYFVNNNPASQEILNNLGNYILRYQDACLSGMNCTGAVEKTCEDNVIIFEEAENIEETKVYKNRNCVYISGDLAKGADAFLYKLLGIR